MFNSSAYQLLPRVADLSHSLEERQHYLTAGQQMQTLQTLHTPLSSQCFQ
jgi:hypothetical protein